MDRAYELTLNDATIFASRKSKGPTEDLFGDEAYGRPITKVIVEFGLFHPQSISRDTAFGEFGAIISGRGIILNYIAIGPKKFLWRESEGVLAQETQVLRSTDFLRQMSLEDLADFAVSEAERLSKKFDLPVQLRYFGDAHYVKKYLVNSPT